MNNFTKRQAKVAQPHREVTKENIINPFDFEITEEQIQGIIKADSDLLKIDAVAGSSKTGECQLIATNYQEDSLYLAFNKTMAEEAKTRMPDNVECRTTHSLAYRSVGINYQHKLSRPRGRYINVAATGSEIARYFKIPAIEVVDGCTLTAPLLGLLVKQCTAKFEQSDDDELQTKHLPFSSLKDQEVKWKNKLDKTSFNTLKKKLNSLEKMILRYAEQLWEERVDTLSPVLLTHDSYLKMYQLTKPKLLFSRIFLDEAQDTSLCVMDIFLNQSAKKVIVGDKYQNIYQWRGAINALDKLDCTTATLTKSFRFGEPVADIARRILENEVDIKGNEKIKPVVGFEGVVDVCKAHTIIYRTNSKLLSDGVRFISENKSVNLEVDITDFMKKLESAKALFENDHKKVKHEEILPYENWEDLQVEAKYNGELNRIKDMVESNKVGYIISTLKNYTKPKNPLITLSTCHKMKGLERDQIVLADDFPSYYNEKGQYVGLENEERNLLYVAVTRAIKALEYNTTILELLNGYQINPKTITHSIDNGVGGEQAGYSLQDTIQEECDRMGYIKGGMNLQEAYDRGFVDELGTEQGLEFAHKHAPVPWDLDRQISHAILPIDKINILQVNSCTSTEDLSTWLDGCIKQGHRLQAYDDWLINGEGEFEGQNLSLPSKDRLKNFT